MRVCVQLSMVKNAKQSGEVTLPKSSHGLVSSEKGGGSGGAFLRDKMVKLLRYALLAGWDLVLSKSCSDLLPESQQFRTAAAHW